MVGESMASDNLPPDHATFKKYLTNKHTDTFNFTLIKESDTESIIKSLSSKNSSSHDGITSKLLKKLCPILIKPLTLIINQSLATGIFPNSLKIAKIISIHKKEKKHLVENYRPISILPTVSKVFERVVFNQIYDFFSKNNLFYPSQYGFRKKHSTEYAALETIDIIIQEMDKGNLPAAIFLDLSKAFDSLDHDILLHKLNYYGIRNSELNWFQNYLKNRFHYTEIAQTTSTKHILSKGVPQGPILGPLLFIIYLNDIVNCSSLFRFIIYADDTNLIIPSLNNYSIITINNELDRIHHWLAYNKLSLNVNKTKFIIFHNRHKEILREYAFKINNMDIKQVESFNFLGITLNENLTWKTHTDMVSSKIARYLGIMKKLKTFIPPYILKSIYNSLILPHLSYGILAWSFCPSRLVNLQKRAIRLISNSKYNAHSEPLFKSLSILKLEDLFKFNILKFYYKYKNNQLPEYFNTLNFIPRSYVHSYNTRRKNYLCSNKTRTKFAEQCIRNVVPKLINDTSPLILNKIDTHSLHGFCTYMKSFYLDLYHYECSISNCYICSPF